MSPRRTIVSERQLPLNFAVRPSRLSLANWLLAVTAAAFLLAYVAVSNQLTAARYSLITLHNELSEANTTLELQNIANESRYALDYLTVFAKAQGMVETKESSALFQQIGVALTPNQ